MTRDELAESLLGRAKDIEEVEAGSPLAQAFRTVAGEVAALDGWPRADQMLTLKAAAVMLGVRTVWLTIHRKDLPFLKTYVDGKTVRASRKGIERWLASR